MRRIGIALAAVSVVAAALLTSAAPAGIAQRRILFDQKVKVPFGLEIQSKVFKPAQYLLMMESVQGKPTLVLHSLKGEVLARITGDMIRNLPEKDRTLKRATRLRIIPLPDSQSPGRRWIVFVFDYKASLGATVFRWRFKIREAPTKK